VLLSHCGQASECTLSLWTKKTSKRELLFKVNAELKSLGQIQPLALNSVCSLVSYVCIFFDGQQMKTILRKVKAISSSVSSIIFHLSFKMRSFGLHPRVCFIFACRFCGLKRGWYFIWIISCLSGWITFVFWADKIIAPAAINFLLSHYLFSLSISNWAVGLVRRFRLALSISGFT